MLPARSDFVLPLRVGLDPMEKLLVADVKDDPEFVGFEPQGFDDDVNGRGMRVLRYRKDGLVDVYWQPGVRVDRSHFVLGAGIGDFEETTIAPARLDIGEHGVSCDVAFTDARGRGIALRIVETTSSNRGFPLLAPVGADIRNPLELLLVHIPALHLARKSATVVEGHVGDRSLSPVALPLPVVLGGHRVLLVRYAARPVIGTVNPPTSKPTVFTVSAPGNVAADGMSVTVDADGRVPKMEKATPRGRVSLDLRPALPNLRCVEAGGSASGRWSISIMDVPITGGSYAVKRDGERVDVEMDVTERWKPQPLPLAMRAFVRLVSKFRTWPSSYRWRGTVTLGADPTMCGRWERKPHE